MKQIELYCMTRLCACGCGLSPRKSTSKFCPGHSSRGQKKPPRTEEHRKKLGVAVSQAWRKGSLREKRFSTLKQRYYDDPAWSMKHSSRLRQALGRPEIRAKMSKSRIAFLQAHPESLRKNLTGNGHLSRLHVRIREALDLQKLGFISEQMVGCKQVDELNEEKKVIVEINGDKWHANPLKYDSQQIISTGRTSFKAEDKWVADANRISYLELQGYQVIVVWESDDLERKRIEVEKSIGQLT